MAFIAIILPLIILVLSTISTEVTSVGEAVKGSKAETAAETAVSNAISLIVQEKQFPNYWVSATQPDTAIIVDDGFGNRRNRIANNGAGEDGVYGTDDDYWIGPRKDRTYLPGDDVNDPRNYDYDFRFLNTDGPSYLGQRWAFSLERHPFYFVRTPQAGSAFIPIQLYNQFSAVQGDTDNDGVPEGFVPTSLDQLLLPGYFPSAIPRNGPFNLDLRSLSIANDMLRYRAQPYRGLPESMDEGPVPTALTRSYASVTDENGRLNLNIFCKKVRLWLPESASYDSRYDNGQPTDDFNFNNLPGELGWHWVDNPLFPDRDTTTYANGNPIDFGSLDPTTGFPRPGVTDGIAMASLGETVQHLYSADWVDSAVKSKRMLMALPGVDEALAENILRALNPDLTAFSDPNNPSQSGQTPSADNPRLDAPNLTPTLMAINITPGTFDYFWDYQAIATDDLPLPPPRPFNSIEELLNVQGMTQEKYERLKELTTIFSYDVNVIQNYISDVSSTVDPINPPDLPRGATKRPIPDYLIDRDTLPDLRYDINKYVEDTSLSGLRQEADILFNHIMNHLPSKTFQKFTLPVIDRAGRGPSGHLQPGYRAPWDSPTYPSYPYNVAEYGHEFPLGDPVNPLYEIGAGYPALDPPFSRDSALSILLYRHGLRQETAYHRYHPEPGRERVVRPGIPVPGTRSFVPIFDPVTIIPGLLSFYFQPTFIPEVSVSQEYAEIPPHEFSSVADILEVPLYKFTQFSVDIMADPPSDYLCGATGKDEVTVRYYVALSDVLKAGEYNDGGTPLDPTDDSVSYTYEIYFDYNNDGVSDEYLPLVFGQNLRLVGNAPTADNPAIITTFDQSTGQRYVVFEHTFTLADVPNNDKDRAGSSEGDFAFDAFGNPFIIARVLGVKAAGTPSQTEADAITRVYLQENCSTVPPLKASILAVRQSSDSFLLMSAVSGGVESPSPFRLYEWDYDGSPDPPISFYPPLEGTPPGIPGTDFRRDPRNVVVTLKNSRVSLTVYDMYATVPAGGGFPYDMPFTTPPDRKIPPDVFLELFPPALGGQLNPAFKSNIQTSAPFATDTDVAEVELVGTSPQVRAEVAVEPPSIRENSSFVIHAGAFGGTSPYDFNIRVLDAGANVVSEMFVSDYERNTLVEEVSLDLGAGNYTVVVTATDSSSPATSDIATTTLVVGGVGGGGQKFTNVPQMVASINLEELEAPQRGFRARMSVSGQRGDVGYYWEVFKYDASTGGLQIARNINGGEMRSNEPAPTFVLPDNPSSDAIYLVKGMVIDQTNVNPNNATNTALATDTAMVVIASPGSATEGEAMALLSAVPPGNDRSSVDLTPPAPPLIYGTGPAPQLTTEAGVPAINPEIAPAGAVIELRGYNFDPTPENNVVRFGGGATARAFEVVDDPSYAGPPPVRRILRVVVPDNALSGWVNVTVNVNGNGGVSNSAFFQTHFVVGFDLIGSISPLVSDDFLYELDYQGDGIIDVRVDTRTMGENKRQIRYTRSPILQHDFSEDGFGNYQATLKVTNARTGKIEISRQLIQIRDLRPLASDPNNAPEAFGLITSLLPSISERYPIPGAGLTLRASTGGVSSLSDLKYKWNVDGNGMSALLRTSTAAETYWESEPNDTPATADSMPPDYDPYTDGADWTGRAVGPGDVDWFSIQTNPAGALTLLMECFSLAGGQNITAELYDSSLNLIDSGTIVAGQNHTWVTTDKNAPAGTYFVRITADSPQTYELESTFSPNAGNTFWEFEPNNTRDTAQLMPIDYDPDRDGFPFTGQIPPADANDQDWYRITTPAVGTLNVLMQSFDQTGGGREIYISLYDSAMNLLDSATIGDGDVANVVSTGFNSPIDTYYIQVRANANNQRYTLDPSFVQTGVWGGAGPVNFSVNSSIHADARYADTGIPINYFASLDFNFTTQDPSVFNVTIDDSVPVTVSWDFNGDGIMDEVIPAAEVRTDLYSAHISSFASYTFNTIGTYNGFLYVRGFFRVTDTANNTSTVAFTLPQPAPLPTVDISNVLNLLQLTALSNDRDHFISVTVQGEDLDTFTGLIRPFYATDNVYIPSVNNPLLNVFCYSGVEPPYSLGNTPGSVNYTLIGIHGSGNPMNFYADINTDGYFEIGTPPFGNPQSVPRVTAQNGLNLLNPGAINSFPTELPGVFFTILDVPLTIRANKGVYTSYGIVADTSATPPAGLTASFETQEILVGGSRAGGAVGLPLAVDIFVNPLIGITTQAIQFESYVSGGSLPYSYQWRITHLGTGASITFANPAQHNIASPIFVGTVDAIDEVSPTVAGDYEVQLVVTDAGGAMVASRSVVFTLEEAPLSAQLLAFPPSGTVDEPVNFMVYVDGGQPPYTIRINYNDPDDPSAQGTTTTSSQFAFFRHTYRSVWLDRSSPPNGRYDDAEDGVNVEITVMDSLGASINPSNSINATQKVLIGERLPLNISLLASPVSGSGSFDIQVNYVVSGGRRVSGGSFGALGGGGGATEDYFVVISLVEMGGTGGGFFDTTSFRRRLFGGRPTWVGAVTRTEASTIVDGFGDDGIFMNGDPGEVYNPVYLHVPRAGNYVVMAFVTDGSGQWAIDQTKIYSEGYLSPVAGGTAPKVRMDRDGRPLHAVRIWVDPLYTGATYPGYDQNDYRLREADIQIFGDLLTVDPNPSFISPFMAAAKDPTDADPYTINYLGDPETLTPIDFYDTFTFGRVNINTASEEVLASVFSKIIKRRAYHETDDPNGTFKRGDRDYRNDVYLTPEEARALAKAVVEYRNAYYDAYKPEVTGLPGFSYEHGLSNDPYTTGDVRVDHLPVIGPWDGANPKVYDVTDRDAPPPNFTADVRNVWDNFRGAYYNLEGNVPSTGFPLRFYAPSDIAIVREQLPGESDEDYARYLNDTLDNSSSPPSDPFGFDVSAGFDARHYFTYDVLAGENRSDARNKVAIFNSNGETAFTFIPNPPFQSIFDLYKVVGVSDPDLYELLDPEPRTFRVVDENGDGIRDKVEVNANGFSTEIRTLSGPSLFRYSEVWDERENRFIVVANYLDDIAPYLTTRSYTYRVKGFGGVDVTGGSEVEPISLDRIERSRSITRIVDVGKLRSSADVGFPATGTTSGFRGVSKPYRVVYEEREGYSRK